MEIEKEIISKILEVLSSIHSLLYYDLSKEYGNDMTLWSPFDDRVNTYEEIKLLINKLRKIFKDEVCDDN